MLDFSTLSDEVLINRGKYSTVRARHEDSKKKLQVMCGELMCLSHKILNLGQSDDTEEIQESILYLEKQKELVEKVFDHLAFMQSLSHQRKSLKELAWGKS